MNDVIEEEWKVIPEFSNYQVSSLGRIYNIRQDIMMRTSVNNFGYLKITLKSDWSPQRYDRSVALLVAQAFIEPPNVLCDHVVFLDGDHSNPVIDNLVWRPRWFAWRYSGQLKTDQPRPFENLPIRNLTTGDEYRSVVATGMAEGLLFEDVWRSVNSVSPGYRVFPNGHTYEVIHKL